MTIEEIGTKFIEWCKENGNVEVGESSWCSCMFCGIDEVDCHMDFDNPIYHKEDCLWVLAIANKDLP